MHDAQMHDNEASNTWRVLQRSKELDQRPKEYKLDRPRMYWPLVIKKIN